MKTKTKEYEAPGLELHQLEIELGFATSPVEGRIDNLNEDNEYASYTWN